MTIRKTLALATITFALASGAMAVEPVQTPQPGSPLSISGGELRLAQTATCLHDSKRFNKGARVCMNGYFHNCNKYGLWVKTNAKC